MYDVTYVSRVPIKNVWLEKGGGVQKVCWSWVLFFFFSWFFAHPPLVLSGGNPDFLLKNVLIG